MNTLVRLGILVLFFILAETRIGFTQRLDYDDKIYFADSVKRIKLFTYIEGDNSFRRYHDAIQSATVALNKKGYLVDLVTYDIGQGIPAQEWEQKIISGLKKNEAFLDISTRINKYDVTNNTISSGTVITNEKGAIIVYKDWHGITDTTQAKYFSKALSQLYVNWKNPSRIALVPVYSKTEKLESGDIYLAVTYTLSGIPASKHPAIITNSSDTAKNSRVPIEITLLGGYTFSSKMDVLEESGSTVLYPAKFNGSVQYGLEIGMGVSKNFDMIVQYRRLSAIVDVNTPIQKKAGSVTMNQNYMLIGMNFNFRVSKVISPYAGVNLGGLNIIPADGYFMSVWYFIMGAQAGTKFYLSKRIGLRLQAEILYQVHPAKASFLYSDDVYKNIPVDAMSNMFQMGISAGFILRLGNK
jgi:hypothetical protein